jgi:hypothetical protein
VACHPHQDLHLWKAGARFGEAGRIPIHFCIKSFPKRIGKMHFKFRHRSGWKKNMYIGDILISFDKYGQTDKKASSSKVCLSVCILWTRQIHFLCIPDFDRCGFGLHPTALDPFAVVFPCAGLRQLWLRICLWPSLFRVTIAGGILRATALADKQQLWVVEFHSKAYNSKNWDWWWGRQNVAICGLLTTADSPFNTPMDF